MNFLNIFKTKKVPAEEQQTPAPNIHTTNETESAESDMIIVYEHERFRVDLGWSHRNLEVGDPKRFTSKLHQSNVEKEPVLPPGWEYVGADWRVDTKVERSDAGWLYGFDFRTLELKEDLAGSQPFVRRRRWIRMVGCSIVDEDVCENESRDESGSASASVAEENFSDTNSHADTNTSVLGSTDIFEEEDEEEDEGQELEAMIEFDPSIKDKARVIRDPGLSAIGRQIRAIEDECRKEDDLKSKEWIKRVAPSYKVTIKELDGRITELRKRIKNEIVVGDAHIAALEEELQAHLEAQDATKRNLYFPNSTVTLGSGGVYFALDDFWLELASGQFIVDLVPSKDMPQVILLLTGTADGNDSGVSVRLKIGGFKLRGDSGKGVPRLSLESVKVTVTIRVTIMLTYNVLTQKWTSSANNFSVEIIRFKGPFGLSRSVVAGTLGIVVPILRGQLLSAMPPEFGTFIASMPSPLSVRGEFNIAGTELKNFSQPLYKCMDMCTLVGYSPDQLLQFIAMQKSIDRKPLKTMDDFLSYRRMGTTHHKHWDEIKDLWNTATMLYYEKLTALLSEEELAKHSAPLSFERILQGTDEILRNPLRVKFTLHNCDGQISIRSLLDNTQLFFERWRATKQKQNQDIGQFVMLMQQFSQALDMARSVLAMTNNHLNFVDLKVAISLLAGANGELNITVNDIIGQAPLALWAAMPSELSFGFEAPVPFVITVCPMEDGSIDITIFHCGSKQIQYRSKFHQWRQGESESEEKTLSSRSTSPRAAPLKTSLLSENSSKVANKSVNDDAATVKSDITEATVESKHADMLSTLQPQRIKKIASEDAVSQISIQSDIHTDDNSADYQGGPLPSEALRVEAVGSSPSLLSRRTSVTKLMSPIPETQPATGRRRSLIKTNSGEFSTSLTNKATGSPVKKYEDTPSDRAPSPPSVATNLRPNCKQDAGLTSYTDKQRKSLEKTLCGRPRPLEAQRILMLKVVRPHMSIIIDKPVTLKAGSELFTFSVGPLDKKWKPFGYGEDQHSAHTMPVDPDPNEAGDIADEEQETEAVKSKKQERQVIPLFGCPMLVQTTNHVKVFAEVPHVFITLHLATLLRFLSIYFEDNDKLRAYLGITSDRAKEATEEYIYLFKVLVDRLGKYLLLPNLNFSMNMALKVVATPDDVTVSFETNSKARTARNGTSENSSTAPCAIKLGARINVMDMISDALAIKTSLLRCAAVYERHIAEDAEAAAALMRAEEESKATHHPQFETSRTT